VLPDDEGNDEQENGDESEGKSHKSVLRSTFYVLRRNHLTTCPTLNVERRT
jgi:hypothetical protein